MENKLKDNYYNLSASERDIVLKCIQEYHPPILYRE